MKHQLYILPLRCIDLGNFLCFHVEMNILPAGILSEQCIYQSRHSGMLFKCLYGVCFYTEERLQIVQLMATLQISESVQRGVPAFLTMHSEFFTS